MLISAGSEQTLNKMMEVLSTVFEERGMENNMKKTKSMVVGTKRRINIYTTQEKIERVQDFKYLGIWEQARI